MNSQLKRNGRHITSWPPATRCARHQSNVRRISAISKIAAVVASATASARQLHRSSVQRIIDLSSAIEQCARRLIGTTASCALGPRPSRLCCIVATSDRLSRLSFSRQTCERALAVISHLAHRRGRCAVSSAHPRTVRHRVETQRNPTPLPAPVRIASIRHALLRNGAPVESFFAGHCPVEMPTVPKRWSAMNCLNGSRVPFRSPDQRRVS